jgi:glucose-1-phosphate cytidylyltransferase
MIKEFFNNYLLHSSDVTIDLAKNSLTVHSKRTEPWTITLVDTGQGSMTGGRLKRVQPYLKGCKKFMLTYGDGVADVDLRKLLKHHDRKGLVATVTAVQQPGRFGSLDIRDGDVRTFTEKPLGDGNRINGGFFVFSSGVFKYLADDSTVLEQEPLKTLAKEGKLAAYSHDGFWHAMDTIRDKQHLENLWQKDRAPWKLW